MYKTFLICAQKFEMNLTHSTFWNKSNAYHPSPKLRYINQSIPDNRFLDVTSFTVNFTTGSYKTFKKAIGETNRSQPTNLLQQVSMDYATERCEEILVTIFGIVK